jgi:hypothetical protein
MVLIPNVPSALEPTIGKCPTNDRVPRDEFAPEICPDPQQLQHVSTPRVRVPAPATATATAPASSDKPMPPLVPHHGLRLRLHGWFDGMRSWKLRIAIGFVIMAIVGVLVYRGSPKVRAIGPDDTIVLAEFTNTTGDPVFDVSLNRALAISLSYFDHSSKDCSHSEVDGKAIRRAAHEGHREGSMCAIRH